MYVLVVYVPSDHLETVKEALFAAGAGNFGSYDKCSWEVEGTGQFRPLEGSNPYIGSTGEVEREAEYRLEVVCGDGAAKDAVEAIHRAHPYEVPAYHLLPGLTGEDL
ncbi:MAG: NGG1p interacting factor NIF3 [Spirochaetia bacterium]